MSFKMKNFKIGVNENGFHFQDSETGVIFTLKKSDPIRSEIAICSKSADKQVRDSLKTAITDYNSKTVKFSNISPEKTYISKNQDLFVLEEVTDGEISIRHKKTNKNIYLIEVVKEVPMIEFGFEGDYYGYQDAVKDFFELCSDKIQTVRAGTYHGKTEIQRTDSTQDIKQKLFKCLVEGVQFCALSRLSTGLEYEVSEERIVIKIDENSYIKMKNFGNGWVVDQRDANHPVLGLVYTVEVMKRLPQIKKVTYKYTFEKIPYDVTITPKEKNKVLKEAVKRRLIDLTV